MKFVSESVGKCSARLGTLSHLERMPDAVYQTPMVLLHTKRGCVPHLTKDVLNKLTSDKHMLSLSLPTTIIMIDPIKQSSKSFSQFVNMEEYPNFLTIQDPTFESRPENDYKLEFTSIWSKHGRFRLNPDKYIELVEAFKPDIYVSLCDGLTNDTSTSKRIKKSIENSKKQFLKCLKLHQESNTLNKRGFLGPVIGGFDLKAREFSANYLVENENHLDGFVIDGLTTDGPSIQNIPFDTVKPVFEHTLNLLPAEKMKVSLGCWNPKVVLELIDLGIDVFDTSYPYLMTDQYKALTFRCVLHENCNKNVDFILMGDESFKEDFSPICSECQCLTCKNHTKAYIKHLVNTKELLAYVLIMLHNTHQYLEFFKEIRDNLKNKTFSDYKKKIQSAFNSCSKDI